MPFNVRYTEAPPEVYKTIPVKKVGDVRKYKMCSVRNKPIEYPNTPIIQSISKRFMTQRGLEPIYSVSYGVDWEKFMGRDMTPDLALSIEQEVHDSLMICNFVSDVNVDVTAIDGNKVLVNCEVEIDDKYTVSSKNESVIISTTANL